MKAARTSSAAKSPAPRRRPVIIAPIAPPPRYTTDGALIGDGSGDPEPVLPGDDALLAMSEEDLAAQHYFTHEEVLGMLAELRAQPHTGVQNIGYRRESTSRRGESL